MQYIVMEKRINKFINKSSKKTLLDSPVPNSKIMFLPSGEKSKTLKSKSKPKSIKPFKSKFMKLLSDPLKPTKYKPKGRVLATHEKPTPIPKPRVK